jgi:xylono-1,5-lactonase
MNQKMPTPIWQGRATLGEGPIWSPRRQRLFFVDIIGHRIISMTGTGAEVQEWPMPARPCWLIEQASDDQFLVGLERAIVTVRLEPGKAAAIGAPLPWPEPLAQGLRLNDAKADAAGRVYFGTMDDAEKTPSGALHAIAPDGTISRHDDGYTVSNGPAISPDGRILYHTDSPARTVYAFDRAEDGTLSGKRAHIHIPETDGFPDGMTSDAQGGLWVCHWDGGRISRFTPDGRLDHAITLPASRVTSAVFFGDNFDRLAITTAAHGREEEPLAGSLFVVDTSSSGLPGHRYGLAG